MSRSDEWTQPNQVYRGESGILVKWTREDEARFNTYMRSFREDNLGGRTSTLDRHRDHPLLRLPSDLRSLVPIAWALAFASAAIALSTGHDPIWFIAHALRLLS